MSVYTYSTKSKTGHAKNTKNTRGNVQWLVCDVIKRILKACCNINMKFYENCSRNVIKLTSDSFKNAPYTGFINVYIK